MATCVAPRQGADSQEWLRRRAQLMMPTML